MRNPFQRFGQLGRLICSLAILIGSFAVNSRGDRDSDTRYAIERYSRLIQEHPDSADAYQQRGVAHFQLGNMDQAIADFDQVIELFPEQEPHHWQRGICYYYAGEFQKGEKQFEMHQTVNPRDVENAVWHFICKAKTDGVDAAREALIPISRDPRTPMMEIWNLFAGNGKPQDVLDAAKSRQALCYAHLYLGLYYESHDQQALAKKHIQQAAGEYSMDNYMGDVARVHDRMLE